MAIQLREIDEWKRLAREAQGSQRFSPAHARGCPRCADLGAAVLSLITEVERLQAPYARAFRDGAEGALDFAARAFAAMGEQVGARVLRDLRAVIKE